MIKRNIIYMKGGKEVHIQNINPNVIQKKKKKEYKSKDAQNSLLQTLESATPQKKKKKKEKKRKEKKRGDYKSNYGIKIKKKEMLYSLLTFC